MNIFFVLYIEPHGLITSLFSMVPSHVLRQVVSSGCAAMNNIQKRVRGILLHSKQNKYYPRLYPRCLFYLNCDDPDVSTRAL